MVLGRFHLQSSLPQGTSPQPRRITPLQLPNTPRKGERGVMRPVKEDCASGDPDGP
jgi:hypothetical protein